MADLDGQAARQGLGRRGGGGLGQRLRASAGSTLLNLPQPGRVSGFILRVTEHSPKVTHTLTHPDPAPHGAHNVLTFYLASFLKHNSYIPQLWWETESVSCGCCNRYHRLGGLKPHSFVLLQFWRPEVQTQLHWAKVTVPAGLCSLWRLEGRACFHASSNFLPMATALCQLSEVG